jgi:5-methylcytosine-specific restriction endonuclease McrA
MFDEIDSSLHLKREKAKARLLRKSGWWQQKIGKAICYYCQKPLASDEATMDHIVPLSRGGYSSKGNIAVSCKPCNTRKKDSCPLAWTEGLYNGENA